MAFVDAQQRTVAVAELPDLLQLRNAAVHAEHAVAEHQRVAHPLVPRLLQAALVGK